ncbi:MAG: hypothetical protein EA364_03130 [Balneolaceae bacterium]|nr:MAG: hypothetical protein EA364_03130 [Balneolaceae bacterium]
MKSLTFTWIIFLCITAGCSVSEDPYKMMIDHMLADTTLVAELWCDTCNQITDYSVHPIVNLDWGELMCLEPGLDPEKIDAYWLANIYKEKPELKQYSTAEISDYHIFFNERVDNIQAMFVFYREAIDNLPYYTVESLYKDPLYFIWHNNIGVKYVFKFNDHTGRIELLCRENQIFD